MTIGLKALRLKRLSQIRLALFLILLMLSFAFIFLVDNMLVSLILAFVTTYLLGPWVNAFERGGLPRGLATTLVFLFISILLFLAGLTLFPMLLDQMSGLKTELPKYWEGLNRLTVTIEDRLHVLPIAPIDMSGRLQRFLSQWTEGFFSTLPNMLSRLMTVLFLVPLLSFFMIKDGRSLTRGMMVLVPNGVFELCLTLYHQINGQLGQFVRARLLEALIVGLVCWIGLLVIQFPYAFLFGFLAGIANLIPYIGPILGAVPPLALAAIHGLSSLEIFVVAMIYLVAQLVDILFIIPFVVARIVNLHPLVVILSILVGAQTMGILGMLISIPMASVLKVTSSAVYQYLVDH